MFRKRGKCLRANVRKHLERNSAQAALEFLMTYGWAILVALVAIVVLSYFGVLSPSKFLPDKCVLPVGVVCVDFNVETYRIVLVLQNSIGESITINQVTVSGNNQQCSDNETIVLNNDAKAVKTITQCNNGAEGSKFNGIVSVSYTVEEKLAHNVVGTLKTKVAAGMPTSSQDACQNAETNGLCDGLDIVYGIGYKAACCSEHSLCCP